VRAAVPAVPAKWQHHFDQNHDSRGANLGENRSNVSESAVRILTSIFAMDGIATRWERPLWPTSAGESAGGSRRKRSTGQAGAGPRLVDCRRGATCSGFFKKDRIGFIVILNYR
jgi:hypothetical protein